MKVLIDGSVHEGSGTEIMEQLRQLTFDPDDYPDTESYIWQLRSNFMRSTGMDCDLPESGTERMALAMIAQLAKVGALEVLGDG